VVSSQGALFCCLAGDDRGVLLHESRAVQRILGPTFRLGELVDAFVHREGRDLTGYLDGTENPSAEAATSAAIVKGAGATLDGGSFVAVQRWIHDLDRFARWPGDERDQVMGRSRQTNEELDSAPDSAHVKRAAQETFDPPAFLVRRSMAYVAGLESGLYFVAYGESLARYERVLRRMLGLDDGITDGLFRFTRPVSGGYYFCPPLRNGRVDLRVAGLDGKGL
jgi:putative iron-dependent peroxidase